MIKRKYTLPRHTNLAKNSSRVGAFLVDLAICIALVFAFAYGCFGLILKSSISETRKSLQTEQLNSGLYHQGEDKPERLTEQSSFEEFEGTLKYFYLNYLTGNDIKEGLEPCKHVSSEYNVEWFNKNVYLIGDDPDSPNDKGLFTFVKIDGNYDKTQIGVKKETSSSQDINIHMQHQYNIALLDNFNQLDYVDEWGTRLNFLFTVEYVCSIICAGIITYLVLPIVLKKGQTVGKKVFRLGLANADGYSLENKQLIMRIMPLVVVSLAFLIPIWADIFYVLLVLLTIFLVSFALAMASPKRMSLHDFTARTIVVDLKTSLIFDNEVEEEHYCLKEDKIPVEEMVDENGEEPEISYEK